MKYLLVFLGLEGSGHHGICSVFSGHVQHNVALENSVKNSFMQMNQHGLMFLLI